MEIYLWKYIKRKHKHLSYFQMLCQCNIKFKLLRKSKSNTTT